MLAMRARMHTRDTMKTKSLPTKRQALAYLKEWGILSDVSTRSESHGYVAFWDGKACGWSLNPQPSHYRPGIILVSLDTGELTEGRGGSYGAGCERFERIAA